MYGLHLEFRKHGDRTFFHGTSDYR